MKKIVLIFSTVFCFLTAINAQPNQTLNLSEGQKYLVDNKLETTSSTEIQGQSMDAKINVSSTYNINVNDKTDNNYNLTNSLSHMTMNMSMMGRDVNFDSDKKEDMDGEIGSALKDYINQPKKVIIDNSGKIISKDDADTSATGIAKQLNLGSTGYGTQMAFQALPKNPKTGDTWTDKTNDNGITRNTNYTIKSIDGGVATVTFDGTVATETTMQQQGMEVSTKTTGKFSGEEKVDVKTGVVQTNTTTGEASGTVSAAGQEFPTSSKVTSTTTVKSL